MKDIKNMNNLVQKNVKTNWDKAFKEGSDKQFPSLELVRVDKIFFKPKKKSKLLEYGFGSGCNTIYLLSQGYNVVGIDVSKYALIHAKKKISKIPGLSKNLKLKILDQKKRKLPFKDNSFDYIVSMSVLSLLGSKKKIEFLLNEFLRILKPGGKILLDINDHNSEFSKGYKEIKKNTFIFKPNKKEFLPTRCYCLPTLYSFKKLVSKYFLIKDAGYSAHKIFGRRINEWIISAIKK